MTSTWTLSQTVLPPTTTPFPHSSDSIIAYPNPAARSSGGRACFAFPVAHAVQVQIYDLLGQPGGHPADQGIFWPPRALLVWDLRASGRQFDRSRLCILCVL